MTLVEGTNDYSIVSKLSAASSGYWEDEFLQEFVDRKKKRASLINWGYYLRNKSLECTFEEIVKNLCKLQGKFQILSVGAGFDTTFFNVISKFQSDYLSFFEIDLPSNVERKTNLIQKSEKCKKFLSNACFSKDGIISDKFRLFACDLSKQDLLDKKLKEHYFNFSLPTVILSECVITYMENEDATNLIKYLG